MHAHAMGFSFHLRWVLLDAIHGRAWHLDLGGVIHLHALGKGTFVVVFYYTHAPFKKEGAVQDFREGRGFVMRSKRASSMRNRPG